MELMPMWKTIAKAAFKKPATLTYAKTFDATRGHIENDIPACIFCGICQKRCPTGAIRVNRAERTWAIARFDCMQCGCCAEVCPKKCLSMADTPPAAVNSQEWLVLQGAPPEPKPADA